MKWTEAEVSELRKMATAGTTNGDIAKALNRPIAEIYAKRSQLGITIDKVAAANNPFLDHVCLTKDDFEFLHLLESLLQFSNLNVKKLNYIFSKNGRCINITFDSGYKRVVPIDADSRAAIIRDVLKGCE